MLSGLGRKDLLVIDASRDVVLRDAHGDKHAGSGHPDAEKGAGTARGGHAPGEGDAHAGQDPHYWLDFDNAARIVDGIARGLAERDPANGGFYRDNAASYRQRLLEIDRKYRESLAPCRKKAIAHGGHFAFGYLAHRYGLEYYTAYAGFTADAEPSPRDLMRLAEAVRRNGLTAIYQEELVRPAIAETVSRETGAVVLTLHPAANVSRADLEKGVTFLDLMELNLANLRRGLSCP